MLVRGAGETFNFSVGSDRMKEWCEEVNLMWAMNPELPTPSLKEVEKIPVE